MPVITQIQLRRGTAAQWTLANPVLTAGEPGVETDTNKIKLGNGVNTWNTLPYVIDADAYLATTAQLAEFDTEPKKSTARGNLGLNVIDLGTFS